MAKKNKIPGKNLLKLDKIQTLVAKCCKNTENIALRSLQILFIFVLRAQIVTTFRPEVVTISARNTNIIQNSQTLQSYIFRILQHFTTKLYYLANFIVFFLAVVIDSLPFA